MSEMHKMHVEERDSHEREGFISDNRTKKAKKDPLKYGIVILLVVLLLVGIAVGIYFGVVHSSTSFPSGTMSDPGKSCLHLKNSGVDNDGYYFIKTDGIESAFQVYCDMKTSGGGWTLVASVHQFDEKNCTNANVWYGNASSMASRNWENNNTFGAPNISTSVDFKSPAYFSLQASDVMLRYITKSSSLGSEPVFQFHTENNFLKRNGGNLQQAFTTHVPLSPIDSGIKPREEPSVLDEILDSLEANSSGLLNVHDPPLYQYAYDDQYPDRLTNGGNNLFDPYGMMISVTGPNCSIDGIAYGQKYHECGNLASRKNYPFFVLLETGDSGIQYEYKIESKRPEDDSKRTYRLTQSASNDRFRTYEMYYEVKCLLSNNIPSFCDLFFTVSSASQWNSTLVRYPGIIINSLSSSNNAVYGYTMIAKEPGNPSLDVYMNEIVHRILDTFSEFPTIDVQLMLDALVDKSSHILNVFQPLPYKYEFDENNPTQDRLSNDKNLFLPYGMKIEVITPHRNQSIEYGKSYKFDDDLMEVSSRKSYPFFVLMKANNPNLTQQIGFKVTQGRPKSDRTRIISDFVAADIHNKDFFATFHAYCFHNKTQPSICDVVFTIAKEKEWHTQTLPYFSDGFTFNDNNSSRDYIFRNIFESIDYTNAIVGYTMLSREPGQIFVDFPLEIILRNALHTVFAKFPFIGLPCSDTSRNLVTPVHFTAGHADEIKNKIPKLFQTYTPEGFLQLRACTFNGDYYALCPGVRVETCEPEYVCVGGVRKTKDQVCNSYLVSSALSQNYISSLSDSASLPGKPIFTLCCRGRLYNADCSSARLRCSLDWPPNGTSYTLPWTPPVSSDTPRNEKYNFLIFYR